MSRFYDIAIYRTEADGTRGELYVPPSMKKNSVIKNASYSSLIDGNLRRPNWSALDIEISVPVLRLALAGEGARIRVYGVSLEDMAEFTYLPRAQIELRAGMLDGGLPLAHHVEPDLLMIGTVFWATGNWEGVNMTLDMIMVPLIGLDEETERKQLMDLSIDLQIGDKVEDAIRKMLEQTYAKPGNPQGYTVEYAISDQLIAKSVFHAKGSNLRTAARELKIWTRDNFPTTKTISGNKYDGVDIDVWNKTITVFDDTKTLASGRSEKDAKPILFADMIGQPSWKNGVMVQVKTVMRGDIRLHDYVKLPTGLRSPFVLTTGGSTNAPNDQGGFKLPSKNATAFTGTFRVLGMRHTGQFRQASALSWTTVFDLLALRPPTQEETNKAEDIVKKQEEAKVTAIRSSPNSPFVKPPTVDPGNLPPFTPPAALPPPTPPAVPLPGYENIIPQFPR